MLRQEGLAAFVDVDNVQALGAALAEAVAENDAFAAITDFAGGE